MDARAQQEPLPAGFPSQLTVKIHPETSQDRLAWHSTRRFEQDQKVYWLSFGVSNLPKGTEVSKGDVWEVSLEYKAVGKCLIFGQLMRLVKPASGVAQTLPEPPASRRPLPVEVADLPLLVVTLKEQMHKGFVSLCGKVRHNGFDFIVLLSRNQRRSLAVHAGETWLLRAVWGTVSKLDENLLFCDLVEKTVIKEESEPVATPPPKHAPPANQEPEHPLGLTLTPYTVDGARVDATKQRSGSDHGWKYQGHPLYNLRIEKGWLKFDIEVPPKKKSGHPELVAVEIDLSDFQGKTTSNGRFVGGSISGEYRVTFFPPPSPKVEET